MRKATLLTTVVILVAQLAGCGEGKDGVGPVDESPPVILGVSASGITDTSAVIAWITDEEATSQVAYDTESHTDFADYRWKSTLATALVKSHSVSLDWLYLNTTYHFRVASEDAFGNREASADFTFTTATPHLGPVTTEDEAVEKVEAYIISRVGEVFFNAYISFDHVHYRTGGDMGERWSVVYRFDMPEYDFVDNELIEVVVSPDGDVLREYGIPDPERCDFITESEAVEIAREAGLAEGIEAPEGITLLLGPEFGSGWNTYTWYVDNITYVDLWDGHVVEAGGDYVSIDAYSGEILKRGQWAVDIDY